MTIPDHPPPLPPSPPPLSGPTDSPARPRLSRLWPLALVCIVALLVLGYLGNTLIRTPERLISGLEKDLEGAFRPNEKVTTVIYSSLGKFKKESKLVVASSTFFVEVAKKSEMRLLWEKLDLGDTVVRVRALDNKVQYYLPANAFTEKNFRYDAARQKLVFRSPAPLLDEDMVEVQSNPEKIEVQSEIGWARLKTGSGARMETEARKALRGAVLNEGRNPILIHTAQNQAAEVLKDLLKPVANSLRPGVELEITFDEIPDSKSETKP